MSSVSDLEREIEESRARLDKTIDRIQDKLTAGNLVDEMLGSARRTPLNGVYDSALEAVRRNPVPVLLIAAGVGLLLRSMSGGARPSVLSGRALKPQEPVPTHGSAHKKHHEKHHERKPPGDAEL